jgi:hypothetical protein
MKDRKHQHKSDCNNTNSKKHNLKIYVTIRENGGWDNWRIVCLEECDESIKTKRQAEMKEENYRLDLKSTMNLQRAYVTIEEMKEYSAKYRAHNSEKLKAKDAQYYADNAEKLKEKQAQYRVNNAEQINARQNQKITCECGCVVIKQNIIRHKKSAKHCKLIQDK